MISSETASLLAMLDHPDALCVCKRPIPVRVAFAVAEGVCETLEGAVRYRAGDAILTGSGGDRWPVRRAVFDATYRMLEEPRAGYDGTYVKAVAGAVARRVDQPVQVPVGWEADVLQGRPGDWLLRYVDGTFGVVQDDIFRKTYEAAAGETRWPPS